MRKKQFLQFRRAMATLLAVAMIGQNTVMTTAENYVADNTAVVAEEQAQEPEVQVEESASPAVQESAPAAETPAEPAAQAVAEKPAEPTGQTVAETPEPAQNNSQEESKPEVQPAASDSGENKDQTNVENGAENSQESQPSEEAKEILYHVTFDEHAADFGKIQVRGEGAPVENISSYRKEVNENESFAFSVKANDGYEVDHVCFADTQADIQKNADGLYEILAVTKDEKVTVTYKAVAQEPVAEPPAAENNIALLMLDETDHEQNVITYYEVVFKYEDKDGTFHTLTTQQIESGKAAVAPAAPEKDGYRFIGWDKDFSNVTADMEVTAQYSEIGAKVKYQIIYQYTDGTVAAQPWVAELEKGVTYENTITSPQLEGFSVDQSTVTFSGKVETDQTITVTYTGTATTYTVKHLLQNTDGKTYTEDASETIDGTTGTTTVAAARAYKGFTSQEVNQAKVNADGSTVVEIKYDRNSYRLTWNTDGGSYVEPSDILYGASITLPKEPTKLGYTFKGWANCPATMPAEDTTVTAKWEINTRAAYRIIYWQESLETPGTYEMAKNKNGEADIVAGTDVVGKNISYSVEKNRYEGFEPAVEKNKGDIQVTADGLAVKNIYYNRKTYIIKFYVSQRRDYFGNPTDWKADNNLEISARYGEDVSDQWNDEKHSKKKWATTSSGGTYYTNFSNMPAKNLSMYGFKKQEGSDIVYYIETIDGKIKEYQSYNISYSHLTSEDAQPIDGFSFDMNDSLNYGWYKDGGNYVKNKSSFKDKVTGKSRNGAFLYYSRNSYALHFENCTGVADASIKFEANVSGYKPLDKDVQPPANVDRDYIFAGWYTSPACEEGTEFNWQIEMPSHTITLYAKWEAPTYTVTFNPNGGTVTESTLTVTKGQTLGDTLPTPTKEGDEFLGWYTDESFTHKFVKESQIVKDQTLYAKWKSSDIITYYIVAKDVDGKELWRSEAQSIEKGKNASVNAQPIDAYYPQELSKSVIINNDKQEIVFIYKPLESWTYTIRYVDESGKEIGTAESVTTTDNMKTVVYKVFEGYQLTSPAVVQAIKGQTTEIVFTYVAPEATYTVEHWLQNPDGTYYKKEFELQGAEKIGAWVTATPKGYTGFTCVSGEIERSGAVVKGGSLVLKVYYNRASPSVEDYTGKYNGQEHTITITAPGIDGDVIQYQIGDGQWTDLNDNFTNLPKYKDCGTTVIKVRVVNNGNVGPAVEAKISITQRKITLTSAKDEKFYDGTPLTNDTIVVGGEDEFVEGEGIASYGVTGSQTEAGESDNVFDYTLKENTKSGNYEIQKEFGKLKVKPVDTEVVVTITEHSGTGVYDGNKQTVTGYDVTNISNTLYSEKDFSFNGNAVIEGTNAGSYNMELKAADFENISKNFTNVKFVIVDGTLEIARCPVTIKAKESSKVYGNPDPAFELAILENSVGDELKDLDLAVIRSDAGDDTIKVHENVLSIQNSKEALEKEYTNYTFTIIPADFTIFENENGLTVSAADVVKEYDGNSYGVTATARIKNAEIENPNITVKYWNEKTNAYDLDKSPEYRNVADTPAVVKFEASLYGYKSVQGEATVTINKRSVLLTSASASKIYDGTPLTNSNVTVTGSGFVDGEVTDIKAIGSVTNVADSPKPNTITFTPVEGKFNADNYAIEQVEGELAITPVTTKVKVEIIGNHVSEKYDGTPKVAEGYVINIVEDTSGVYQKDDIEVIGNDSAFAERTDAGTTFMGLKADAFANGNPNFTNITIVVTDGYVEVIPRSVTLTSESAAKVYDGTPLIRPDVTIGGDGFVNGEVSDVKAIGSALNVSDKDVRNEITFTQKTGYKAENYDIKYEPGTLRITPIVDEVTITITEHSASLKYNGAEQSVTGYDTAIDNTLYKETDFTFSGDATAKGTDFGSYPMNLKAEDFTNKNKNFANVVFEIVDGQLEITKRDVELISGSDEKVYDGTPLTKNHILIAGDQFVPGEGADYDVTGSQTNAGSSDNEFAYRLNSSTKAINYNIKTTPGTLKVTPVTDNVIVTITEHSGSAKYDGTEKTVTGYDVAIDNELYTENDFTFSGNDVIKATDADIYNMELKPSDFNNISHNFASVTFKIVDGTLNISRRDVTLTSATDSKTYDGKPLTNDNVAVGGDGFAEGEGAVYNVTGSQTEAGFSNNTFSYELKDNTKPDNYNITPFEGILTVSSSEDEVVVTITGNKGTQKYDGTEKTVEGYTVSITSPLYKESDFNFDGIALVKGTNADTYMMGLSEENFTNTNKNFAKVTFHVIDGSLVIEKRNLVLTSASAQKVYNGTELTAKDVTVSGDGFVKGEGASYDVTGTQTTVGDSENTFTYKLNENTNADNYTIETKNGSLLVTPVTDQVVVTLKENSGTEVYDGTEKTVTGYTVADISNKLYTDKDFTFTGNAEVKGTDAGTYDMELKAEDFQNINPNFTNVVFKVEDGALEITRRQVTFQADSGEKKYDGEELTAPTWKLADGTLADGQQEIAHVEGSQTLVGESENKITDLKIFANAASQKAEGSETEAQDVTKNYSIILLAGLLKVTDGSEEDPVDPGQVVTKTHEDKTYDLDETVTFTINVKNIYDEAKTVRIIELPGVVIEGAPQETPNVLTVEKVPAGETVTATATYKITEADIANGSFVNTVKVEFEGGKPFENTDTVTTVDPVRSYTLTKKSSESTHENGMFKAGETIHYTLIVTNTGNQTLENVEITDTLNAAGTISNIQGADSKQDGKVTIFTISSLAPKAEATITYDYVVQEADKGNTISNAAVGTPANPENPDGEKPEDNTDNPVENPKLEVKKDIVSITAADGTQKDKAGKADLNDIITYSVTVTNTGNVKLTNVKITDSLEGIQLAEGQSFDLGILEAGEAKTVTYTYQVKESDLGKSILNTATATGDVPENPADTPKPEGKDEKEVPTEDPANCSITVTKRLTNIQGELLAVRAADFYVTLFSDEAMTQKAANTKMIHFDENQGTSSVTFDQLKRGTYYVAETDAEGKVVAEGTYNNGSYVAQYQAGNKVEITENGTAAQFQFDNQFLLLPDEYYIVKTITINKTVVKKNGEDLKSEETFYAGIFKDEDCTQLADGVSQNIVPLVMDGESTATAKTEVTVPVGGEEIKLYVTEVTADGTPVALNETFEYDVEINDGFVTLSETSEDATVLIINTSRKEEPEPTAEPAQEPTEAPAEPTQAPQVTQQPEDRAVTTNGVKTGDDSPLTQLAFMLFAASAAILLIIFLKKKDEKDIMK